MLCQDRGNESRRLRMKYGISRRKAGELIGVTERTVFRMENVEGHKLHPWLETKFSNFLKILTRFEEQDNEQKKR